MDDVMVLHIHFKRSFYEKQASVGINFPRFSHYLIIHRKGECIGTHYCQPLFGERIIPILWRMLEVASSSVSLWPILFPHGFGIALCAYYFENSFF